MRFIGHFNDTYDDYDYTVLSLSKDEYKKALALCDVLESAQVETPEVTAFICDLSVDIHLYKREDLSEEEVKLADHLDNSPSDWIVLSNDALFQGEAAEEVDGYRVTLSLYGLEFTTRLDYGEKEDVLDPMDWAYLESQFADSKEEGVDG